MSETLQQAKIYSMKLLGRRDYARGELASKLQQKYADATLTDTVLAWLEQQNYLNDARFSEAFVRSRVQKGQGPKRILQELRQRGVSAEHYQPYLDDSGIDWQAEALRAMSRKFGDGPPADLAEKTRRARFLEYRGFAGEQIWPLLGD